MLIAKHKFSQYTAKQYMVGNETLSLLHNAEATREKIALLALTIRNFALAVAIPEESFEYTQLCKTAALFLTENANNSLTAIVLHAFTDVLRGTTGERREEQIPAADSTPSRETTLAYANNRYEGDNYSMTIVRGYNTATLPAEGDLLSDFTLSRPGTIYTIIHKNHGSVVSVSYYSDFPEERFHPVFTPTHVQEIVSLGTIFGLRPVSRNREPGLLS